MPYKSDKQRKFMHAQHPQIARRWDKETGGKVAKATNNLDEISRAIRMTHRANKIGDTGLAASHLKTTNKRLKLLKIQQGGVKKMNSFELAKGIKLNPVAGSLGHGLANKGRPAMGLGVKPKSFDPRAGIKPKGPMTAAAQKPDPFKLGKSAFGVEDPRIEKRETKKKPLIGSSNHQIYGDQDTKAGRTSTYEAKPGRLGYKLGNRPVKSTVTSRRYKNDAPARTRPMIGSQDSNIKVKVAGRAVNAAGDFKYRPGRMTRKLGAHDRDTKLSTALRAKNPREASSRAKVVQSNYNSLGGGYFGSAKMHGPNTYIVSTRHDANAKKK